MKIDVLVGMIGSGKTTYAQSRAFDGDAMVVSHDDMTEMLHQTYIYHPELKPHYLEMMKAIATFIIGAKRDAIIDRTHLTRESRREWVELGRVLMVPVRAIVFPIEDPSTHATRRANDDGRGRSYADWLRVAEHHRDQSTKEPIADDEGFSRIIRIGIDEKF